MGLESDLPILFSRAHSGRPHGIDLSRSHTFHRDERSNLLHKLIVCISEVYWDIVGYEQSLQRARYQGTFGLCTGWERVNVKTDWLINPMLSLSFGASIFTRLLHEHVDS
jgi:hypothetical protein